MIKRRSICRYGLLGLALLIYSMSSLCSKLAAGQPPFSWEFVLFYGLDLLSLMVYALVWQHVLKHFDLSVAYAAKPVTALLSMAWGVLFFGEHISWNMALGAVVIFSGIWIVVTSHEE